MSDINITDKFGTVHNITLQTNPTITITGVDLNEPVVVNASAATSPSHIETTTFIGPSKAGQPITKR